MLIHSFLIIHNVNLSLHGVGYTAAAQVIDSIGLMLLLHQALFNGCGGLFALHMYADARQGGFGQLYGRAFAAAHTQIQAEGIQC